MFHLHSPRMCDGVWPEQGPSRYVCGVNEQTVERKNGRTGGREIADEDGGHYTTLSASA